MDENNTAADGTSGQEQGRVAVSRMTLDQLNEGLRGLGLDEASDVEDGAERLKRAMRSRQRMKEPSGGTLRAFAEEALKKPMTYSAVLERVRDQFPECKTSRSSLRWYAAQMRRRGEKLPERPLDI